MNQQSEEAAVAVPEIMADAIVSRKPEGAFEELVVSCRSGDKDFTIHNTAWDHALFLFYNLLEVAIEKTEPAYLISGTLNQKFYGDPGLVARFHACLDKKIPVDILVVNNPRMDIRVHPLGYMVPDEGDGFSIIVAPKPIYVPHMLVIGKDGRRYRYETDHDQTKAKANFNDPYTGSMLVELFRHAKSMCLGEAQATAA